MKVIGGRRPVQVGSAVLPVEGEMIVEKFPGDLLPPSSNNTWTVGSLIASPLYCSSGSEKRLHFHRG